MRLSANFTPRCELSIPRNSTARPGLHFPDYAFIDADNVYGSYKKKLEQYEIPEQERKFFDFRGLFCVLEHDRRYIYSAKEEGSSTPEWLRPIEEADSFILNMGTLTTSTSGRKSVRKQEGVDVKLAIDATRLSYTGVAKTCTLYGADGDFIPLVKAITESGSLVRIVSFSDPNQGRVSPLLRASSDEYKRMNGAWIYETLHKDRKTVQKRPDLFHAWNDSEDVDFRSVHGSEVEIKKIDNSWCCLLDGKKPFSMRCSHSRDDLLLYLSLVTIQSKQE